jgi:large subunit ribosomal protein L13
LRSFSCTQVADLFLTCPYHSAICPAQRLPERIIEHAVKGMLPKGRLGRKIRLHLKVYKGDKHPHAAQQPTDITSNIVSKRRSLPAKQ